MKINVLEIIGDPSLAGAPRHLLSIIENLDLEKFNIHVICPAGPLAGEIRHLRRHVDVEIVPMRSRLDMKAIREIRKNIKHIKPDIIHVHGTRAGSVGRLATIGLRVPVIYTEHLWTEHFKLSSRIMTFFHYFGNWFFDMFTNLNIAVSQAVKDFMVSANISRADKIVVVYNGIEPSNKEAKVFQGKGKIKLITVATLNEQKGIQFLIRALPKIKSEFPDVELEIVGDGPHKKALVNEVKKLKLSSTVDFVGFVSDVEKELLTADIYVQPSLSESFGLAIIQAMNVGLPIVATHTGGIPEVVTQGKSGILVASEDPKALSDAILDLMRQPAKAKEMGKTARGEVKLKFDLSDMVGELEDIYEEMASTSAFDY